MAPAAWHPASAFARFRLPPRLQLLPARRAKLAGSSITSVASVGSMAHADLECWLAAARSVLMQPLCVEPHCSHPPGAGMCPPSHTYSLGVVSFHGEGGQTQLDALVGGAALHLALTYELVEQYSSQDSELQVVREAPGALTAVRSRAESHNNLHRIAKFIVPPELMPACVFSGSDPSQQWICATYVEALIGRVSSVSPDSVQALARWLLHHDLVAVASSRRMLEPQRWRMRLRKPY